MYVDNIMLTTSDLGLLRKIKAFLDENFEMKGLGEATYVTGIEIYSDRSQELLGPS